ncbi:hypothetical protein ACSBR1_042908 [Camellia fascicularis]
MDFSSLFILDSSTDKDKLPRSLILIQAEFPLRSRTLVPYPLIPDSDFLGEILEEIKTLPNDDSDSELESSSDDHWSNNSSLDSKAEIETEPVPKSKAAHFRRINITLSSVLCYIWIFLDISSLVLLMAEIDNPPSGGKRTPPKDFVCPITSHVFHDPVTLETGQTYEREAIQEWLDRGNCTCPITRQKLPSTQLPKTNYVLKRLIASWQEQNPNSVPVKTKNSQAEREPFLNSMTHLISPNIDGTVSELRQAITNLCMSEILKDSEMAVLRIELFWQESKMEVEIQTMLSKPPVINGFVEILLNSVDLQVLTATVFLLSELGSRDHTVIQIGSDPGL